MWFCHTRNAKIVQTENDKVMKHTENMQPWFNSYNKMKNV